MGFLGWAPLVFWAATPHELNAAIEGLNEKNGGGSRLTEEQVAELQRMRDEAVNGDKS
jgi:hypothetical protein